MVHLDLAKEEEVVMDFTEKLLEALEEQGERVTVYTSFTTSSCNHTQIEASSDNEKKDATAKKAA